MTPRALPFLCATLALGALACDAPEIVIDVGQEIRHDDFNYTVQQVAQLDRIGARTPKGAFYVVTVQVDNHAKRVSHEWDNSLAYITDAQGRVIDNDVVAQQALDADRPFGYRDKYSIPAGVTARTQFVFDVPKDVTQPYLMFRGQTFMGDALDGNQFRHTRVKLFK